MTTFPIARFRFNVQTDAPLHLPEYAGSMLRGAFGHALLGLTVLPHKDNQPCALHNTCPYCQIFLSAHNTPASYIIEPPPVGERDLRKGESFNFHLVLIGKTQAQLPLIIHAFERALKRGLGKDGISCILQGVCHENGDLLWPRPGSGTVGVHTMALPPLETPVGGFARLHFVTPLRLQHERKIIGLDTLDARALLLALARRQHRLCQEHLDTQFMTTDFQRLIETVEHITLDASDLCWRDFKRYSSRQQQETPLSGLMGELVLQGPLDAFATLLHLGQWLHVGKQTVFGLGHYQLEWY